MKFGIFVHPERPKVSAEKIIDRIRSAGITYSSKDPDVAVVVGGDGTFGYYGRTLSVPLLFVGVKGSGYVSSRAKLARVDYKGLINALRSIENGMYLIKQKRMLSAGMRRNYVDVLTDIYIERGNFAGCLRYEISIRQPDHDDLPITDYAIGNGLVVSTSFGAGGYFSYPDRLLPAKKGRIILADFNDDQIGICHIIPTHLVRKKGARAHETHNFRYTVSADSEIQIRLLRDARACLYGTTLHSRGIPVRLGDTVKVIPSGRVAKIVELA